VNLSELEIIPPQGTRLLGGRLKPNRVTPCEIANLLEVRAQPSLLHRSVRAAGSWASTLGLTPRYPSPAACFRRFRHHGDEAPPLDIAPAAALQFERAAIMCRRG
jgi:hypothetical protein